MTTEDFKDGKNNKRKILGLKVSPSVRRRGHSNEHRDTLVVKKGGRSASPGELTKSEKERRMSALIDAKNKTIKTPHPDLESSLSQEQSGETQDFSRDAQELISTEESGNKVHAPEPSAQDAEGDKVYGKSEAIEANKDKIEQEGLIQSSKKSGLSLEEIKSDNTPDRGASEENSVVTSDISLEKKLIQDRERKLLKEQSKKPVRRISIEDISTSKKLKNLDHISREEVKEEKPEPVKEIAVKSPVLKKHISKKTGDADSSYESDTNKKSKLSIKASTEPYAKKKLSAAHLSMGAINDYDAFGPKQYLARKKKKKQNPTNLQQIKPQVKEIEVGDSITVQDLAMKMATKSSAVIKSLMKLGAMVTLNEAIDTDTAEIVITEFGHTIKRVKSDDAIREIVAEQEEDPKDLKTRAPVVAVMGHVDHGKTSLLDALRITDVAAGESGGITQHIGAYRVDLSGGKAITFLDTPGHEAFTAMRMRGALVTDIIVLVVAADEGIKAQTVEAIGHAKAAEVPIIVAVNKMDLPGANLEAVKMSLMSHDLIAEDYGGDVMVVGVSAKKKIGLDKLEEAILFSAELMELKASENCLARGRVIESKLDKARGVLATLLVQKGTLKIGDVIVAGEHYGKVKAMKNDKGNSVKKSLPSFAVEVLGLSGAPMAGDDFLVVEEESSARKVADFRTRKNKENIRSRYAKTSLNDLFATAKSDHKDLLIVLRGDVQGSIEAIEESLKKIKHDEVGVKILMKNVGGITESDITLASASKAVVMGFNVRAFPGADSLSDSLGVEIRYYSVIYDLIQDIKDAMSGLLKPHIHEKIIGHVEIRQVFNITGVGRVAGSYVKDGTIKRGSKARLLRDRVIVYDGHIESLQKKKDSVKEAASGHECGISLKKYGDFKEGDVIEAYEVIEEARTVS